MYFHIFLTIAVSVPLVYTQQILYPYLPRPPNWDPRYNGFEDKFMQFTGDWKREIVAWGKDCIFEIKNKIYQVDQINWAAADDIRFQIGQTIGRILELHRQQEDMYRRFKRRMENRFNWIHPDLGIKIPQLPEDGAALLEPRQDKPFPSGDFGYPWREWDKNKVDYKPHVYIIALEFVTKRESDIEHLVKLITNFMSEEEVSRFKPHWLPAGQDGPGVWGNFSTMGIGRRQGPVRRAEEAAEREEEAFKAKMRAEYYRKRNRRH